MTLPNPYRWDRERPIHRISRAELVGSIATLLRRGEVVRVVGGRGMGKSVLLGELEAELNGEPETRVVLFRSPPESYTVEACIEHIFHSLWGERPPRPRLDDVLERLAGEGHARLILLFDEVDQYVTDQRDSLARQWFNFLEARRKQASFDLGIVVAGGLGLLYLEKVLGSGLISRATSTRLPAFTRDEVAELAAAFEASGRRLTEDVLALVYMLTGGNPALVTYALQHLWEHESPALANVQQIFGRFEAEQQAFIRGVWASVGAQGQTEATLRVHQEIRTRSGQVDRVALLAACAARPDEVLSLDLQQCLDILCAAGLVEVTGSDASDPLVVHAVESILNLPKAPTPGAEPIARLLGDVEQILCQLHRFGRDFHDGADLLEEQVFSSMLAVSLAALGWREVDREALQAAGFTDLRVRLDARASSDHAIVEVKIWPHPGYKDIQQQVDDYRISSSAHGVAVTLGKRGLQGWAAEYESACLAGRDHERLPASPDLVGRWRVRSPDPAKPGAVWLTDHFLVQLPKRG